MCQGSICSICHHKSWVGCGKHIALVMDNTPKENWCTCDHVDNESDVNYPPRASTGFAKKTTP